MSSRVSEKSALSAILLSVTLLCYPLLFQLYKGRRLRLCLTENTFHQSLFIAYDPCSSFRDQPRVPRALFFSITHFLFLGYHVVTYQKGGEQANLSVPTARGTVQGQARKLKGPGLGTTIESKGAAVPDSVDVLATSLGLWHVVTTDAPGYRS